jgi:hypothetical protein
MDLPSKIIPCLNIYFGHDHTEFLCLLTNFENLKKTKFNFFLCRTGGIPARTASGQRLLLYVGIIDILQSYHIRKKLEHTFKSVLTDGVSLEFDFLINLINKFLDSNLSNKSKFLFGEISKISLYNCVQKSTT